MDNMKKLLYISTIEDGPYQGVRKKISMQCKAFEELGLDVTYINSGKRTFWGQIEKLLPTCYGVNYRIIKKRIIEFDKQHFDYCYVRYSPASRGLIDILKTLRNTQNEIKIVLEIPTYPYEDELRSLKSKPFKFRDRLFRNKLKEYVDLVITPSHLDEDTVFGIPAFEITNGIDVKSVRIKNSSNKHGNIINLIGVALITDKQGYDRVIRGISTYEKTKEDNDPSVCFYIIGTGNCKHELEELCDRLSIKDCVVFTGEKDNEQLDYYYDIADCGVGTLGLYKTNELLKVNSLKTREYCAKGLPFVIADCDYMFAENNFEFCMVVNNDDAEVDIRAVIHFINSLKQKYSNDEIAIKMNTFANDNLSWSRILEQVLKKVQ